MCMHAETTVRDVALMSELSHEQKVNLVNVFYNSKYFDLAECGFTESKSSEYKENVRDKQPQFNSLYHLACDIAVWCCYNITSDVIYKSIVTQFTKMHIEQFNVYAFQDMRIYYDDPGLSDYFTISSLLLRSTIQSINAASSLYESNKTMLELMIGNCGNIVSLNYKIQAGYDIIKATPQIYYFEIAEPIELQHKVPRAIVIVDLSEKFHIVSFGVVNLEELTTGAEMPDMQHLYTVDLDTEYINKEYIAFTNQVFSYYMKRINAKHSKEVSDDEFI